MLPVTVRAILGEVPLHLWGTKLEFLRSPLDLAGIASLDSAAWNGLWGAEHDARRQSGLSEAQYCWEVSYPSYAQRIAAALQQPKFSSLIGISTIAPSVLEQAKTIQVPLPECLCYPWSGKGSGE